MTTEIDLIDTTEIVNMTEIATETTDEEIVLDLILTPSHLPKAAIVVIERKRDKKEDVLEAELIDVMD